MIALGKNIDTTNKINSLDLLISKACIEAQYLEKTHNNTFALITYEKLIYEELINCTNIEYEFRNILFDIGNVNSDYSSFLNKLIINLSKSNRKKNVENLLLILNEYLENQKLFQAQDYSLYSLIKSKFEITTEELKTINAFLRKDFKLEIQKLPKFLIKQIKSKEFIKLFENEFYLIRFKCKARNINYLLFEASKFVGAIQSVIDKNCIIVSDSIRPIKGNYKHFPIVDYYNYIITKNNKITYPNTSTSWSNFDDKLKNFTTPNVTITWPGFTIFPHRYVEMEKFLKSINKHNPKIKDFIIDILNLHTDAISETQLSDEFLKYWIIFEKIIKCSGKKTDEKIIKTLKNFVIEEYKPLVNSIYVKRNQFVHELNSNLISNFDKEILQLAVDKIINTIIFPPINYDNLNEMSLLLENINKDKTQIKKAYKFIMKI